MCGIYVKWHICDLWCALTCAYMRICMSTIELPYMTLDIYGTYMSVQSVACMPNAIYVTYSVHLHVVYA